MNPTTCAKNATPPRFGWALNSPKFASISWYRNHAVREVGPAGSVPTHYAVSAIMPDPENDQDLQDTL